MGIKKVDEKAKMVSEKKKNIMKMKTKKVMHKVKSFYVNNFNKVKDKYISLDKFSKQILFVWVGILLIIVCMAIFVSLSNASLKKYARMEAAMDEAAFNYSYNNDVYGTKDEKVKLPLKSLLLSNDLSEEDVAHKSCDGFSVIYYDDELEKYIVESFISCDRYTTDFYNDY